MDNPKEKAKEIIYKMQGIKKEGYGFIVPITFARLCAHVAIDEIINNLPLITEIREYWQEVKEEVDN